MEREWITEKPNNSSNSSVDGTVSESIVPPNLQYAFGVLGNLTAMFLLCRSSGVHKWKPFYKLVGGLAITDFCGIALVYPAVMVRYISGFTFEFPKQLCDYFSFCFSFTFMSSAMIVSAMSFDRFMAVAYPILYRDSQKSRVNIMLVMIWAFNAILSSLNLMGVGSARNFYPGSWCFLDFASKGHLDKVNTCIYSIIGFIILTATIIMNIFVVYFVCRKVSTSDRRKSNDVFIIVFLFTIVILFSICWVPLMVRMLINAISNDPKNGPEELLAVRMTVSNAIVDPWIYIILRKENLSKILGLIRRIRNRKQLPAVFITEESKSVRAGRNRNTSTNAVTNLTQI
ncbi:prostaglandin E2 receptor EP4 subtype-like [Ostrea edulis]|uniref:prostaglandin E2 receptor EP4 subtype-like n=1 Tax=Ostrea edulis TaxID=37623 RepID=UPI002095B53E|nr:prostaglandin E2 receptor EP4 subtype-like [Ostrea edulis]